MEELIFVTEAKGSFLVKTYTWDRIPADARSDVWLLVIFYLLLISLYNFSFIILLALRYSLFPGPIRSFTVKYSKIGLKVSETLSYTLTNRHPVIFKWVLKQNNNRKRKIYNVYQVLTSSFIYQFVNHSFQFNWLIFYCNFRLFL